MSLDQSTLPKPCFFSEAKFVVIEHKAFYPRPIFLKTKEDAQRWHDYLIAHTKEDGNYGEVWAVTMTEIITQEVFIDMLDPD